MTTNAYALSILTVCLLACGTEASEEIIDIGKVCSAAADCEYVCTREQGAASGRCSIECDTESDCPSAMECVTSSSTGERRCFAVGGIVTGPVVGFCQQHCRDVDYFCSSSLITDVETNACVAWCSAATSTEAQAFIDCVDAEPRYLSACPAAECVLDRIP
ncbi:MAG: hypothetical protein H0T42_24905 [Deltaproteobacteria bacterium]|nr:hypothetical protein [Deltaproteobacteria bacterium]